MLRVAVLGSTGSIGRSTLDVIAYHPEKFTVVALAAGSNWQLLAEQARIFHPQAVCISNDEFVAPLRERIPADIEILVGEAGLEVCATLPNADAVVVAVVGALGVASTYAAAVRGKRICLANKESLVAGGSLITAAVKQSGAQLLPVDSEHSAIFQCLQGATQGFSKIHLTASGGPFRTTPAAELNYITPAAALRHPTWNMGGKITIDSATLMNKGLEVIEAHWLFGADYDQIRVVVHPQSVVHSMVEFIDGSILAQLGAADMRLPIQVALLHPQRFPSPTTKLNPLEMGTLTFEKADTTRFPSLELAYAAGRAGGSMPVVLNAANEVAVELFLQEKLSFTGIPRLVEACMARHAVFTPSDIAQLLALDVETRKHAHEIALRTISEL